jgi:hypothetical protein
MKSYTKTWQLFLYCDECTCMRSETYASKDRNRLPALARAEGWCLHKNGDVFCPAHTAARKYEERLREEAKCGF